MDVQTLQDLIHAEIVETELKMVTARSKAIPLEDNIELMELEHTHDRLSTAWDINNSIWSSKS